jgi:hypothetical protein
MAKILGECGVCENSGAKNKNQQGDQGPDSHLIWSFRGKLGVLSISYVKITLKYFGSPRPSAYLCARYAEGHRNAAISGSRDAKSRLRLPNS